MIRAIALGMLLAAGALTLAVAGCRAPQQEGPKVAAIAKVKDDLYVITGGGGNTAAFITDTGVVLVDTKLPGWGPAILDRIRSVTDKPVILIINTHSHPDHVRGNESFPVTVDIVAQEHTKATMETMPGFKGEKARFLPKETFKDRMSLLGGKDRIDLYYFGAGHTNGDAIVVFPALRAAHFGDLFAGKAPPIIDRTNGGSGVAFPRTLSEATAGIKDVDTIITGHGDVVMTWPDLVEYAAFNAEFLAWTSDELKRGVPAKDAAAAYRIPPRYKDYVDQWRLAINVQLIYDELMHVKSAPASRRHWWNTLR